MKSKAVTLWLPDEELWFELYFQLSIAEARKKGILLPKTVAILAAFNETFVGKSLKDAHGRDTEPRSERQGNAFASKLNRMCVQLRNRLNQCVFGKSGDVFVPKITIKMLRQYKEMKSAMAAKGIIDESAYADSLEDWNFLFSHLPNADEEDMQDASAPSIEEDVAATLLSLRTPVLHNKVVKEVTTEELVALQAESQRLYDELTSYRYPVTPQQRYGVAGWLGTPEESFTSPESSSQGSYESMSPPRVLRCATPVHEMDISALIASPD